MADYLLQIAYNFFLKNKNSLHRQKDTIRISKNQKEKSR